MKTKTLLLIALWSPSLLLAQATSSFPPSSPTSLADVSKNVTAKEYCDFLNAVAAKDSDELYDEHMSSDPDVASITRSGSLGSYRDSEEAIVDPVMMMRNCTVSSNSASKATAVSSSTSGRILTGARNFMSRFFSRTSFANTESRGSNSSVSVASSESVISSVNAVSAKSTRRKKDKKEQDLANDFEIEDDCALDFCYFSKNKFDENSEEEKGDNSEVAISAGLSEEEEFSEEQYLASNFEEAEKAWEQIQKKELSKQFGGGGSGVPNDPMFIVKQAKEYAKKQEVAVLADVTRIEADVKKEATEAASNSRKKKINKLNQTLEEIVDNDKYFLNYRKTNAESFYIIFFEANEQVVNKKSIANESYKKALQYQSIALNNASIIAQAEKAKEAFNDLIIANNRILRIYKDILLLRDTVYKTEDNFCFAPSGAIYINSCPNATDSVSYIKTTLLGRLWIGDDCIPDPLPEEPIRKLSKNQLRGYRPQAKKNYYTHTGKQANFEWVGTSTLWNQTAGKWGNGHLDVNNLAN